MGIDSKPISLQEELLEQIRKAEEQAVMMGMEANAVVLNEDFDYLGELHIDLMTSSMHSRPMILGKHVFIGKMPSKYSFALITVGEYGAGPEIDGELEYYKERCRELEKKIDKIKEML